MTVEEVIPESGSVVAAVVGTPNISLFCDLSINGTPAFTNWFKQSPLDREEGRLPKLIISDDNFILSGDIVKGFSRVTNLTISSLTEELDEVIIFCGLDELAANFILRIYRKPWMLCALVCVL